MWGDVGRCGEICGTCRPSEARRRVEGEGVDAAEAREGVVAEARRRGRGGAQGGVGWGGGGAA